MLTVTTLIVLPAIVACIASASISYKFLDSSARQPEMFDKFQKMFVLLVSTTDALPILSVLAGFAILFVNPAAPKDIPVQEAAQIVEVKTD